MVQAMRGYGWRFHGRGVHGIEVTKEGGEVSRVTMVACKVMQGMEIQVFPLLLSSCWFEGRWFARDVCLTSFCARVIVWCFIFLGLLLLVL